MDAAREDQRCVREDFVAVDMGTTNTRVWAVRSGRAIAQSRAGVGIRDSARDGSSERLRAALKELIAEVCESARALELDFSPVLVAAAGMITSALGLCEVPHLEAPVGKSGLARGLKLFQFETVCGDLPVFLVPGVRCGEPPTGPSQIGQCDVMRGEETLCLGLMELGLATLPSVVLNLGSHWKAIGLDSEGRIAWSVTSMSGELIHGAQTQTVLAGSVPQERPEVIDWTWCWAGMNEQRRSGLARALFCVRLLELNRLGTAADRLSFLVGCFIASDLDGLRKFFNSDGSVLLVGGGAVGGAWRKALELERITVRELDETLLEPALLSGLCLVLTASGHLTKA
jgi:2-dehydro-3-deoxygalactonokinase